MIQPKSTDLSIGWYGPVDGRWMSLLGHLPLVEVLDRQGATEWLQESSEGHKLLIGLEHRSDPSQLWIASMLKPDKEFMTFRGLLEPLGGTLSIKNFHKR